MVSKKRTPIGTIPRARAISKTERVWNLLEQAQQAPTAKQRAALLQQILVLDPDNADAYSMLAEQATTIRESLALLNEAVQAGVRSIEKNGESVAGLAAQHHLWLAHEARPYMRARAMLAQQHWFMGDRQPAIDELWALLLDNPNDNQGIRYLLLGWLMTAGSLASVDRLVALYPDDGATSWQYDLALHAFRATGDCASSRKQLASAVRTNPHVPAFLLRVLPLPDLASLGMELGDESDAARYAAESILRWSEHPAALEWLAMHQLEKVDRPPKPRHRRGNGDGPSPRLLQ